MQLIDQQTSISELRKITDRSGWDMVKGVVDIEKRVMVIDAELHADEEAELLRFGSKQSDLWGINLYPELFGEEDFIEFDSMINVRPSQGNRTRSVDDVKVQMKIREIVKELVT